WITAYLLYQHQELGRRRNEDEQRVRTMLHGALDAVITIDARSIVTTWNPQAEKIFGFTPAEALRALLSDLIIPPAFVRPTSRASKSHCQCTQVYPAGACHRARPWVNRPHNHPVSDSPLSTAAWAFPVISSNAFSTALHRWTVPRAANMAESVWAWPSANVS
ncbi:MAG: PAS domain-containing protein, partial [Nitrospira sp.]|nr:PAS domain-containing protein [Nitrospira sp.]